MKKENYDKINYYLDVIERELNNISIKSGGLSFKEYCKKKEKEKKTIH